MQRVSKTLVSIGLVFIGFIALLLIFSGPFSFSLANVDRDSTGHVLLSQRDELYLILPEVVQGEKLKDLDLELRNKRNGNLMKFDILRNYPPYPKLDASDVVKEGIIISVDPSYFERGDYELSMTASDGFYRKYNLKLRYDFTAPWEY